MGIVTTYTPKVGSYVYYLYTSPCDGVKEYRISGVLAWHQVSKLAREHRTKPPEPLVYHPTSRPDQSITQVTHGYCIKSSYQRVQCSTGWVEVPRLDRRLISVGSTTPGFTLTAPTPDWAQMLRLKIESSVVSFAETIGEYREAIRYVNGGIGVMERALKTARWLWRNRRHRRRILRRLRKTGLLGKHASGEDRFVFMDVISADLAIKFGIRPILTLSEDAVIQAALNRHRKGRAQVTVKTEKTQRLSGVYGGSKSLTIKVSSRAIVYYTLKDTAGDFTSGNMLEAAWAGARLSFMIDWFLNVSRYLNTLDSMSEVESVVGTVTTRTWEFERDDIVPLPGYTREKASHRRVVKIRRAVITSVPLPRAPMWQPTPSWGKLQSAIEVLLAMRNHVKPR